MRGMVEVPKYPFMARRNGSKNFYYKRPVPKAPQAEGRPKQIWRSLENDDSWYSWTQTFGLPGIRTKKT
jgi:hypothetical protein